MSSKKKVEVPCWERRFVTEMEMIGMLDLTIPEWDRFRRDNFSRVRPNGYGKFDRQVVEPIFARQ